MRGKIDCYLPCDDLAVAEMTVSQLRTDRTIRHIFLLVRETITDECPDGCTMLTIGHLLSTDSIRTIAEAATTDYVLLFTQPTPVLMGQYATERLLHVAADSGAAMVYADHYSVENGKTVRHPVIDYQEGSIRDDFDFGSLMLIRADILREYVSQERLPLYAFAGL